MKNDVDASLKILSQRLALKTEGNQEISLNGRYLSRYSAGYFRTAK
jgi:hypothetical protein